jgi:hypothetical protein
MPLKGQMPPSDSDENFLTGLKVPVREPLLTEGHDPFNGLIWPLKGLLKQHPGVLPFVVALPGDVTQIKHHFFLAHHCIMQGGSWLGLFIARAPK